MDTRLEDLRLADIAHGLALENRFAGQSRVPYSVAEHSVRVSWYMEERANSYEWCLLDVVNAAIAGLGHDAHEGLGWRDLPRPLKHLPEFEFYRHGSDACQDVIWGFLGVTMDPIVMALVHRADGVLLATEKRDLMGEEPMPWATMPDPLPEVIKPWGWEKAESMFLERYEGLCARRALLTATLEARTQSAANATATAIKDSTGTI